MSKLYDSVSIQETQDWQDVPDKSRLTEMSMDKISQEYHISKSEVRYLYLSFCALAPNKRMTIDHWTSAMGVRGVPRASHLAVQIFKSMDEDRDGLVLFQHYVKFTNLLASSSIEDKARYSFRLLDHQEKGYIEQEDIAIMMLSLFEMWNILTGSKVHLLPEYIERVMSILDINQD